MLGPLLTPAQQAWMIVLWAAWFSLLVGGFVLGTPTPTGTARMPRWTRLAASGALVIASWSWLCITKHMALGLFTALIAAGMTAGFVGDLAMARLLPVRSYVLGGMVAFGIGHVAYVLAFASLATYRPPDSPLGCLGAWGLWLTLAGVGWWLIIRRSCPSSRTAWFALPYSLLAASTSGVTTCLAMQDPLLIPAAIGAAFFFLSDTILAAMLFAGLRFRSINDLVWFTYGPAQMLIVYSVPAALQATT